jgi:FAD synthetase
MGVPCYEMPCVNDGPCTEDASYETAIGVIQVALKKYCRLSEETAGDKYDLDRVLVAFNGGKDCTLMLHLILEVTSRLTNTTGRIRVMYILDTPEATFPEVHEFVEETKTRYQLESIEVANGNMKGALEKVVSQHPEVRAIFMGTRWTDPNAGWMDYFCSTSPGWPKVDLIAPILRMTYVELWRIMHRLSIAYCPLYKRGYTSIGTMSDTLPNPVLKLPDGSYLHADKLTEDSKERLGRLK